MGRTRHGFVRSICQTLSVFTLDQLVRAAPLGVQFVNVAREAGLRAKAILGSEHKNKFLLETTGAAFFDYDNDGWPGIFPVSPEAWWTNSRVLRPIR